MPLQATSGAASYDAFGGGVPVVPNYIEEVFSTYLYTGTGAALTITNGIDLSTKGGLVWVKDRTSANSNFVYDTLRGVNASLITNSANAQGTVSGVTAFNTNGFGMGTSGSVNNASSLYASWTFRKQPKFFDVVTWSGNGVNGRNISHSLGSVPACIIVKRTDTTSDWTVYHRSLGTVSDPYSYTLALNTTAAQVASSAWNDSAPTSTTFQISSGAALNASGGTYVAYLFAHNAGGFGLTGTDNVISCGSFTTDGSGNATVNLGYEPQWVMFKNSVGTGSWRIYDSMRGIATGGVDAVLFPNLPAAQDTGSDAIDLTSTGFIVKGQTASNAHIYIAIRRDPMKVPTSGTNVFEPKTVNNNSVLGGLMASDMGWFKDRATTSNWFVSDRLRGITGATASYYNPTLYTNLTDAEATPTSGDTVASTSYGGTGVTNGNIYFGGVGLSTDKALGYSFKRAPSFFDVVCAAGTSTSNQRISHNLTVVPELIIAKGRNRANAWPVYSGSINSIIYLNSNSARYTNGSYFPWGTSAPTTTDFGINSGTIDLDNFNGVFYLFATCAGVSKVGSYTGTATTLQIDCGFTGGARFVLIKKTSGTGSWYVWDSARGIVSGNDPYLLLNSTAAEVTNTDYIDTYSAGFEISSTAPSEINENGGSFIFLAIA